MNKIVYNSFGKSIINQTIKKKLSEFVLIENERNIRHINYGNGTLQLDTLLADQKKTSSTIYREYKRRSVTNYKSKPYDSIWVVGRLTIVYVWLDDPYKYWGSDVGVRVYTENLCERGNL